jgi:hypothetical protein
MLLGASAGATCLVAALAIHPDVTLEFDRDLPRIAIGLYPPERSGDDTFAWTSGRARVLLAGLDRRHSWACTIRFRGGRPTGVNQPQVQIVVDGVTLATRTATNDYQDFEAIASPRAGTGLAVAIVTTPTYVPGASDRRDLGVQVDRLACRPTAHLVWPPPDALIAVAVAGAAFGLAFAIAGFVLTDALLALLVLTVAQAVPVALGVAPYTKYPATVGWIAVWIAGSTIAIARSIEWSRRRPLERPAQLVVILSSGILYLKLLALLHPAKLIIDAVFQAHRFEWVLGGRYYFTQPVRNTEFPYAIALYVFAAPWSILTSDHVALLRVVVCATEVFAGALLYWLVVQTWADRFAGVVAVVLFNVVPLAYTVVGNANLTNAFGQSAALVTIVAASTWTLRWPAVGQFVALSALAAVALLSHVSTFALLGTMLFALACAYAWKGGSALRPQAWSILAALSIAVVVSVVSYYGHFGQVYQAIGRVRAQPTTAGETSPVQNLPEPEAGHAPAPVSSQTSTSKPLRAAKGLAQAVSDIGWPMLFLAGIGLARLGRAGWDRLTLALAASGATYLIFFVGGAVAPVAQGYERYTIEFVSRLNYATYPAVVILAARGSSWAWRAGLVARLSAVALVLCSIFIGAQHWLSWVE